MYDKHKIISLQMICSQSWSDIEDSGFHSNIDGREILDDSTSVSAPANIDCKVTLNTTKHIIHRDIKYSCTYLHLVCMQLTYGLNLIK